MTLLYTVRYKLKAVITESLGKGFLATGTSCAVLVSDWNCVQDGHVFVFLK